MTISIGRIATVTVSLLIFANFSFLYGQRTIPSGTRILVRIENGVGSETSAVDDTFTAVVAKPTEAGNGAVLPAGSVFSGRVLASAPAGGFGKDGKFEVRFERIRFKNGEERNASAVLVDRFDSGSSGKSNALSVFGGTIVGGLIGMVSKGAKGAAIGLGVGAGAGTGVAYARKGKNFGFRLNDEILIELTEDLELPADGY
ncbi:MAG: hypothetical protein R2684_00100 [Pyrinomonadaceae bacterium]